MESAVQGENKGSTNTINDPKRRNCDVCNLQDIHVNDFEKHCNGRKHKYNLRPKNKELQPSYQPDGAFRCWFCKRTFTDLHFHEMHLRTKTHKRNLRRLGMTKDETPPGALHSRSGVSTAVAYSQVARVATRRLRRLSTKDHIQPMIQPLFIRKKYKIRNIKTEDINFKPYICSLTAFLSMRLAVDQNVEEFFISVDDKDWGLFGDITVQVFYKDKTAMYAIQCKRVNQVRRSISCLEEAKVHVDKLYDQLSMLRTSGIDFAETKFLIFTTYSTGSNFCKSVTVKPQVLNKWKSDPDDAISEDVTIQLKPMTKKNDIINATGESENIYSFHLTKNLKCTLPHIFLYTNQRVTTQMIDQLLKSKFDNYPSISKQYTKYIENWVAGKLGGNYKLNKKDVIMKIGETLLAPFTVSPKKVQSTHDSFETWVKIIEQVDLTVVKNEPFTISKVCQPFNIIIEKTLRTNIDTITKSVNIRNGNQSILDHIKDPIKSYLFEVVQDRLRGDIPLDSVYKIFWRAGKIPLLLSSEDQEEAKGFILDVISFMKQMGVSKKFLLKSADLNLNNFKGNLQLFTSLDDIKNLINLDEVKIRVSETLQLSLSTIHNTDPFFFKWVTPNIFFDISLNKYSLKPMHSVKKKELDDVKIILSDELKEQVQNCLYKQGRLDRMNSGGHLEVLRGVDPRLF